jgi:hypothetical protein
MDPSQAPTRLEVDLVMKEAEESKIRVSMCVCVCVCVLTHALEYCEEVYTMGFVRTALTAILTP